jgi:hypothetical protein
MKGLLAEEEALAISAALTASPREATAAGAADSLDGSGGVSCEY